MVKPTSNWFPSGKTCVFHLFSTAMLHIPEEYLHVQTLGPSAVPEVSALRAFLGGRQIWSNRAQGIADSHSSSQPISWRKWFEVDIGGICIVQPCWFAALFFCPVSFLMGNAMEWLSRMVDDDSECLGRWVVNSMLDQTLMKFMWDHMILFESQKFMKSPLRIDQQNAHRSFSAKQCDQNAEIGPYSSLDISWAATINF